MGRRGAQRLRRVLRQRSAERNRRPRRPKGHLSVCGAPAPPEHSTIPLSLKNAGNAGNAGNGVARPRREMRLCLENMAKSRRSIWGGDANARQDPFPAFPGEKGRVWCCRAPAANALLPQIVGLWWLPPEVVGNSLRQRSAQRNRRPRRPKSHQSVCGAPAPPEHSTQHPSLSEKCGEHGERGERTHAGSRSATPGEIAKSRRAWGKGLPAGFGQEIVGFGLIPSIFSRSPGSERDHGEITRVPGHARKSFSPR